VFPPVHPSLPRAPKAIGYGTTDLLPPCQRLLLFTPPSRIQVVLISDICLLFLNTNTHALLHVGYPFFSPFSSPPSFPFPIFRPFSRVVLLTFLLIFVVQLMSLFDLLCCPPPSTIQSVLPSFPPSLPPPCFPTRRTDLLLFRLVLTRLQTPITFLPRNKGEVMEEDRRLPGSKCTHTHTHTHTHPFTPSSLSPSLFFVALLSILPTSMSYVQPWSSLV